MNEKILEKLDTYSGWLMLITIVIAVIALFTQSLLFYNIQAILLIILLIAGVTIHKLRKKLK